MVNIRPADANDLECIRELIKHSFGAMTEMYGSENSSLFDEAWEKSIQTDLLSSDSFQSIYFSQAKTHFWVAESSGKVIGCVGLKNRTDDEAELVRMAVTPKLRSKGIGRELITVLTAFCTKHGYSRIVLYTANPKASHFYSKHGFITTLRFAVETADARGTILRVSLMEYRLGDPHVRLLSIIVDSSQSNNADAVDALEICRMDPSWPAPAVLRTSFTLVSDCMSPPVADFTIMLMLSDQEVQPTILLTDARYLLAKDLAQRLAALIPGLLIAYEDTSAPPRDTKLPHHASLIVHAGSMYPASDLHKMAHHAVQILADATQSDTHAPSHTSLCLSSK